MVAIYTEIKINSTVENAWKELMNFTTYTDWNPFIKEISVISKELKVGCQLKVNLDGFKIKPTITKIDEHKEFHWLGRLFLPRIFDGNHIFEIQKISENSVNFIQKEKFRGILAWPLIKIIGKRTKKNFIIMNESFKIKLESGSM
jgi:hypothetical protein